MKLFILFFVITLQACYVRCNIQQLRESILAILSSTTQGNNDVEVTRAIRKAEVGISNMTENNLKKVHSVMESLSTNFNDLKSGNALTAAKGAFTIASAVAILLPPPVGPALSAVTGIIAFTLSFFSEDQVTKSTGDLLTERLDHQLFRRLKSDIESETNILEKVEASLKARYLLRPEAEWSPRDAGRDTLSQIKVTFGTECLTHLKNSIHNFGKQSTKEANDQAWELIQIYVQFASFRDAAFVRIASRLIDLGASGTAVLYLSVRSESLENYNAALEFLHAENGVLSTKYAGVLANYYPIGHNKVSRIITDFMNIAEIRKSTQDTFLPSPSKMELNRPWKNRFIESECDGTHLSGFNWYPEFETRSEEKLTFTPRSGYFQISQKVDYPKPGRPKMFYWAFKVHKRKGDARPVNYITLEPTTHGHKTDFLIIRYKNDASGNPLITISPRNEPLLFVSWPFEKSLSDYALYPMKRTTKDNNAAAIFKLITK